MNPLIRFRKTAPRFLVPLVLTFFAASPLAQAVSPAPDGGYDGANTAEGDFSLDHLAAPTEFTSIGNTAVGYRALFATTTGISNTATGANALDQNTEGGLNTATGFFALYGNTKGGENTATGAFALSSNTADGNTANGASALFSNTAGGANTAIGNAALHDNKNGNANTATGNQALFNNTGDFNTATGDEALLNNTSGNANTALGFSALGGNTTGSENTAIGDNALGGGLNTGSSNTAIGALALLLNATGSNNIALGSGAGGNLTTGDNNIDIGNPGVAVEGNTIRIGTQGTQTAVFIAGISGTAIGGGGAVRINSNGQLGTAPSSQRFKENIKAMGNTSDALHALRPVTFRYKKEFDSEGIQQFGLVAEEVERVNPNLVARDAEGKPYTVRYDAVNAMLLNEFLKEHRKVDKLEAALAQQEKEIEALTVGLQKMSAHLEASNAVSQMVLKNQ
jgi:hypothetical protein